MKFCFFIILATLCICQLRTSEARGPMKLTYKEKCPENSTQEQCESYAKEKAAKKENTCTRHRVTEGEIVWNVCAVNYCYNASGLEYEAKLIDLTKPYPDCCTQCYEGDDFV